MQGNMRFLKGPLGFIVATTFLNFAGLTIIIPVIPYIVQEYTNHVALYVGLIVSLAALAQFLVSPGIGYLSDFLGRRPVILLSLVGGMFGYIIFGIGGSLWVLFLARIIDGLSSGDTTAMYAYVADTVEPSERARYYGTIGAAGAFGFMVGPAIGGIAAQVSLSTPLFVAAALAFANAWWGYFVLPESLQKEKRIQFFSVRHLNPFTQFQHIFGHLRTLRVLFLAMFFFFTGIIMQQSNISVFLKDALGWGPEQIGILLTVVGLVDFITEGYFVGRLSKIFGDLPLARVSAGITACGLILVGAVAKFPFAWLLFLAAFVYTVGDSLFEPAMSSLVANATDERMQGRVQGASQSMQSIARFIAPLAAGAAYQWGSFLPYLFGAMLVVFALGVLIAFNPRRNALAS